MKGEGRWEFRWVTSIRGVDKREWDELAAPLATPFLEYDWLSLLETSGSVCPATGWAPLFLLAFRGGRLCAASPLYRKTHSEGEFVFDYFWAEAAEALRTPYFPKLVGMSPLTPANAFQFLSAPGIDRLSVAAALCEEIMRLCRREGFAGVHFNYVAPDWVPLFRQEGFISWEHPCYLWENRGYSSFDDYLSVISKNGRRTIRREEKRMALDGVAIRLIAGEDIPPSWHALMYRFYVSTNEKYGPWAARYLTEEFFKDLFRTFRRRIVLSCAFLPGEDEPAGMALLLYKNDRLWGRYWGARVFMPALHFNVCYYAPIRWAIAQGVRLFDPGIGGEHKAHRGFRAVPGTSLHYFLDPRLQALFKDNIGMLNDYTRSLINDINDFQAPVVREGSDGEQNNGVLE